MTGDGAASAASIGHRVRAALESADLDEFAALLSPDVTWGAPGAARPACRNRQQVLAWYRRGRAAGTTATVTELTVHGDALLVGLVVAWEEGPAERWQVLAVGPDGIRDIRGFEDRHSACSYLGE